MTKKQKFNIFKTFDVFNSESISIIKDRIIKFVLIEADNFFIQKIPENKKFFNPQNLCPVGLSSEMSEPRINLEYGKDDIIYFSVLNNKRMYNLLANSWNRYKNKAENESIKR